MQKSDFFIPERNTNKNTIQMKPKGKPKVFSKNTLVFWIFLRFFLHFLWEKGGPAGPFFLHFPLGRACGAPIFFIFSLGCACGAHNFLHFFPWGTPAARHIHSIFPGGPRIGGSEFFISGKFLALFKKFLNPKV